MVVLDETSKYRTISLKFNYFQAYAQLKFNE